MRDNSVIEEFNLVKVKYSLFFYLVGTAGFLRQTVLLHESCLAHTPIRDNGVLCLKTLSSEHLEYIYLKLILQLTLRNHESGSFVDGVFCLFLDPLYQDLTSGDIMYQTNNLTSSPDLWICKHSTMHTDNRAFRDTYPKIRVPIYEDLSSPLPTH